MQKLSKLLISKKTMALLGGQLAAQDALLKLLRELLPAAVAEHCNRAIPHDDVLVLLADSSAWASRLRYLGQDLLRQLRERNIRFRRLQIKVSAHTRPNNRKLAARRAKPLSLENASMLQSLADCVDDKDLQRALQRLSRHAG